MILLRLKIYIYIYIYVYIDDSYVNDFNFFLPLSTDDRKNLEIKVSGGDLIAYKSLLLTICKH